jgi:NAD(P)-dependent dehydrogenase (short-subunit alcohol dehydrogenase family)
MTNPTGAEHIALVTGATRGIGAAIALELAQKGMRVVGTATTESGAARISEALGGFLDSKGVVLDVNNKEACEALIDEVVKEHGALQVLVNNAGALYVDAVMDIELSKWNHLLSVNLSGYLLCSQLFGRQMRANGRGAMVHIASISASIPQPYSGAYSVSKAGVKMLSQLLAVELGEHRIRSNVVSPAMIRTPMSEGIYLNPAVLAQREAMVPAGRISTPADIAESVLFLASDRASYISGQEVLVDGGLTQSWLGLVPRPGFEKQDAVTSA